MLKQARHRDLDFLPFAVSTSFPQGPQLFPAKGKPVKSSRFIGNKGNFGHSKRLYQKLTITIAVR
jgi:hypothetical protein